MRRSLLALGAAIAVSGALVALYAALGGGSYAPPPVADPCQPRPWRSPDGTAEAIEQIVLSTADGAACTLGVSREELVLALGGEARLDAFARSNGISREAAEEAVRRGLERAIDDAEQAGAIGGTTAGVLRSVTGRLPVGLLLEALERAVPLLPG